VSEADDEPVDQDLLLAFTTEPDRPKPQESDESLIARVDSLERTLAASTSQIESLKAEVATLVGVTGDISKGLKPSRTPAKPLPRVTSAMVAALGIAIGIAIGWTVWSANSVNAIAPITAPKSIAAEQPAVAEPTPEPASPIVAVANVAPAQTVEAGPAPRAIPAKLRIAPVEYVGTLSIDAAPSGRVFINRQPAGQTPLRLQNLKAGSHLIWIERDGYRRFTRVVQVPADRVSRLWADLEPIPVP
jgi:hypothetical protein